MYGYNRVVVFEAVNTVRENVHACGTTKVVYNSSGESSLTPVARVVTAEGKEVSYLIPRCRNGLYTLQRKVKRKKKKEGNEEGGNKS